MAQSLIVSNVDDIVGLCQQNTVFYKYTEARPTRENILHDMNATPPGIDTSDKYYIGFYDGASLIAIMDLIDGYPEKDIAYIGFFMMDVKHQGKQIGSSIISEVICYLRTIFSFNLHCTNHSFYLLNTFICKLLKITSVKQSA